MLALRFEDCMQSLLRSALVVALVACNAGRGPHETAAALLTREHREEKLRASAAGSDCRVLLVEIETESDDDLVESIHYGTGQYGAFGGVEQFAQDRGFRAVIYRDAAGAVWTYGATTREEARSIPPCGGR
jgi:hypothetical protein